MKKTSKFLASGLRSLVLKQKKLNLISEHLHETKETTCYLYPSHFLLGIPRLLVMQLKLLSGQTVVLINGTLPDYLNASLTKNSDAHSRTTRNHCNLNLLRPLHKNISMGTRTFAVRTVKDWNSLPRSLKANRSLKSFKAELWKTLLNSQKTKGSFDINSWQYIDVFARFSLLNRSV